MPMQDDFQREERRSILLAGLSIILLALIVSPAGSLLVSSLALLAVFWVIYALGMIVYFSDDLFQPKTRRTARVIGLTCFFVYPVAVMLTIVSAAAAAYLFPYPSIINWFMVAVGTSYSILIGGRIFRFQRVPSTGQTSEPGTGTLDEISAVFHKAEHAKQRMSAMVEKIPKPAIRPIAPLIPGMTSGISDSLPPASPRLSRKMKTEDSAAQKKPLGQTTRGRTPSQSGTTKSISQDSDSTSSS